MIDSKSHGYQVLMKGPSSRELSGLLKLLSLLYVYICIIMDRLDGAFASCVSKQMI